MEKNAKIFIAGATNMIGRALMRELTRQGYADVVGESREMPDFLSAGRVEAFFNRVKPDYVFLVAGRSGGISANQRYPADLIFDNLMTECHVINSAYRYGAKKLLYLASSCSYPRLCPQPMKEEYLLTGPLEPTNEAYAVAKIAGVKLCESYRQQFGADFITGIPANIFGWGDDFSIEDSHVIAALIRKMHEAKTNLKSCVDIWGTGKPVREFIFADDLADACICVMNKYSSLAPVNLGSGCAVSMEELALAIKDITQYQGTLHFDTTKPDGMPVKILDSGKLRELAWQPRFPFPEALRMTYQWYLEEVA